MLASAAGVHGLHHVHERAAYVLALTVAIPT